jgi:serine protease Do
MRKAAVAGIAALVLVAAAFVVAPTVWSQTAPERDRGSRDRRVMMLDGRGSAIGVSIRDLDAGDSANVKLEQSGGVLVEDVEEDGPAAKAGIRGGDVIVEFDGERVRSARHFARLVQETPDGRSVKAVVVRAGSRQTIDVTPGRGVPAFAGDILLPNIGEEIEREVTRGLRHLPRDFAFDFRWDEGYPSATVFPRGRLGAELAPMTDQLAEYFGAKQGVLVSSVQPESAAARAGLKAGDVITSVNGRTVDGPRDVMQELRDAGDGKDVEIAVLRDKKALALPRRGDRRQRLEPDGRSCRSQVGVEVADAIGRERVEVGDPARIARCQPQPRVNAVGAVQPARVIARAPVELECGN